MTIQTFQIPFGKHFLSGELPCSILNGIFESNVHNYHPERSEVELIHDAMEQPYGSPKLEELAAKAKNCTIIASDHTRPVPSKLIFPELLKRLRAGNPDIQIRILIATGCHRGTTRDELIGKFGGEIVRQEEIIIHDCRDEKSLVTLGTLPSGAELRINRAAAETDLLLSEGFIEPHFFAGFSGGRKSVLPGIAAEKTVMGNHCSAFISDPHARAGILENNPLHRDMVFAAQKAKLRFIVNVIINEKKQVIHAVAGDVLEAHAAGCDFLRRLCGVNPPWSDAVITGNGGYPLDQNLYQSVKGMSAAEAVCRKGGVIIMAADCSDGHGGESFFRQLSEAESPAALLRKIEAIPQSETVADQWEAQILARILAAHHVIMITSEKSRHLVEAMKMQYAPDLPEAIRMAREVVGQAGRFSVIPDGVSVISLPSAETHDALR